MDVETNCGNVHTHPFPFSINPDTTMPELCWALRSLLTDRQYEVATRIVQGKSNKVIARELGISDSTVKIHVTNIFNTLGVRSRTRLAVLFDQNPPTEDPRPTPGTVAILISDPPDPSGDTMADLYTSQVAKRMFYFRTIKSGSLEERVLNLIALNKTDDEIAAAIPELQNAQHAKRHVWLIVGKAHTFSRNSLGRLWSKWVEQLVV